MSQGGRIALRYAATRPERVRSLVLQGTAVDGLEVATGDDDRVPINEYVRLAKTNRLDAVVEHWLAHPLMHLPPTDTAARRLVEQIMRDYSGRDLLAFDADGYAFPIDVLDRMSTFEKPVLIVTGAEETDARRRQATELLSVLTDGREIVLKNSGHLANLTAADAYNATVLEFILAAEPS